MPFLWLNRQARRWWPLIATTVAGVVIATMVYVVASVAAERDQLRIQNEQLAGQSDQLAAIIDRGRRQDAGSEQRLQSAVDDVEELLVDYFARHDQNSALKLNELLDRIAQLLGRPAGIPIDPVTAEGLGVQPATSRSGTRNPAPTSPDRSPPPAPTTTTQPDSPGRSGLCDRLPLSPICRSNQ